MSKYLRYKALDLIIENKPEFLDDALRAWQSGIYTTEQYEQEIKRLIDDSLAWLEEQGIKEENICIDFNEDTYKAEKERKLQGF